ncbi:hypothetical protein [Absidia glauca]|uniref:Ndc10 domain-containing protein n=1 Tax=Absidia glauca TaxID=4829 RepID=A0A168P5Z5_ABSGL|nr:hypothetical protein [Absidia glauca]
MRLQHFPVEKSKCIVKILILHYLKKGQTIPHWGTLQTAPPGQNQSVYAKFSGTQFEIKIKPPRQAQEWPCSYHRESIGKALSSPGIRSNKNTHINCGSSARMASNVCANVDQIRRQGRWNNPRINGAYLTNLPREFVRSMAGFPTYGRFLYLARDALNPPTSLCKKLKAFIQDSVLMMELHPSYPIWQHSIFSDPAYLSFKRDMLQIEAQERDPALTLLQQCAPMHIRFQTPIGYNTVKNLKREPLKKKRETRNLEKRKPGNLENFQEITEFAY